MSAHPPLPSYHLTLPPPPGGTQQAESKIDDASPTSHAVAALLAKPTSPTSSPALLPSSSSSSSSPTTAGDADGEAEAETSDLLSSWEMLKLCIPVIPSQLGWAVGEALLIPYLMSLGLAETTANAIWLVNPLVGFFVQPLVGASSDACTSRWGRRRPFLLVFHFGIIVGLVMIGFAPELHGLLFPHTSAYDEQGRASATLLTLIFSGCVIMELSNDLLTIPSRALLNDCLPEEQIDQGNAWFSAMNSLGAVIGLTMCFLPLNRLWPLQLLGTQMRATFVMCIGFIMSSNLFTMTIDEWMEDDEEEGEGEGEGEGEEEEGDGEEDALLGKHMEEGRLQSGKPMHTVHEADDEDDASAVPVVVVEQPAAAGGTNKAEEGEGDGEAEGDGEEEEEEEEAEEEPSHMSLLSSLLAFRLLPPALMAIWVTQFSWWLVVMQISFWWTTWVGIIVYGGEPLTSSELFYEGVTFGIVGTLVHSIVSFFSSQVLTRANNTFGVTRVYHGSAVMFSLATMGLWWWRSKEASMVYMVFTGFLYPVINTNPFILIEVYTGYDDGGEGEGEEEGEDVDAAAEDGADDGKHDKLSDELKARDPTLPSDDPIVVGSASPPDLLVVERPGEGAQSLGDFLYQSHTETDSGSSESSSSSSSSDSDADLLTPATLGLDPSVPVRPLSAGAADSVSESEGSMSEGEGPRYPAVSRALNLSQFGYDLSTTVNEGYAFSDGETVKRVASSSRLLAMASPGRMSDTSGPPSPYGSPLPLSSLLPAALESTSHVAQVSPDSPLSPGSPLTPLVSPGMVATVAAQHAHDSAAYLTADRSSLSSVSPPPSADSAGASPASAYSRLPLSAVTRAQSDLSPLPPSAHRSSGSEAPHAGAVISPSSQPNAQHRGRRALSITITGSDPSALGTSIFHPHAEEMKNDGTPLSTDVTPLANVNAASSPASIHAFILQRNQRRGSADLPKASHSPPHPPSLSAVAPQTSPVSSAVRQVTAEEEETAAEANAEEELEEAEEEEIEYLKASTHRGVLTAIMNLSMGLSQIISATVGGVIISWWGDITIVFVLSGMLSLAVNVVVMAYGWSSVDEETGEEEGAEGDNGKDEAVEKEEVGVRAQAAEEKRRAELEHKRREERRQEEERRRSESEAAKKKDRERILRRFMRGEPKGDAKDSRGSLISPEHEQKAAYGSFGSAAGVPVMPIIPHRKHRHRHHAPAVELTQPSSSVPSASHVPSPSTSRHQHRHRRHRHQHRASSPGTSDLDRHNAQAYLMHALAHMSRMHSGQAAHARKPSRPGTALGKRGSSDDRKRGEHGTPTTSETTPLLSSSAVPGPSPLLHSTTQPTASSSGVVPQNPLTSLLSHPSHQRLLYEITVLLHYYHVHHISLLPLPIQERIFLRLRKQLTRHRRRLPHHHRIDADITSRRGLSGRYAMGEEVKMERERLHLMKKRRRRRIRRQERERRDRLGEQDADAAPQQPASP